jgi:hypothetical protein
MDTGEPGQGTAETQLDIAIRRVREEKGSVDASAQVARFGSAF